jgi:AAA15 family ATPase/GTPase
MLIEFRVTNYRSFRADQALSLVAATFSEHDETNTFKSGIRGFDRFLRSAVVYGPNAAGKTNLLRGLQFMQQMVINSAAQPSLAATLYSPHKFSAETRTAPSKFEVTFAESGVRYEYGFSVGPERIESEWLIEYLTAKGRTLFQRDYDKHKRKYDWSFSSYFRGQRSVWRETTRPDALFLSTAIQLNNIQLMPVFRWFQSRLVTIVGPTFLNPQLTVNLLEQSDGKETLLPFLREADLGIIDVDMKREPLPVGGMVIGNPAILLHQRPGQAQPDIIRVSLSHWDDKKSEKIALDFIDESSGTQVLFRTAGAWLNVFKNGEVLLFDEIDTNLHPLLVKFLVERFHSDESNQNDAQLIFSTHNTSLLQQTLFRRDQVWFVEKDDIGASKLYPLTDFHPRNDEVLEKNYMRGRYGALPVLPSGSNS